MANKNKHRPTTVLPILGYYLTFIHYFGFSINPNDDVNSRYLSIRVKRAQAPALARPDQLAQDEQQLPDGSDQWLASYKVRAQRTFDPIAQLLIRFLRTSIKFTAITFTTFIALNHCIVLADYIHQGSKVFLELMLEVRLVITKFSALIFVLSWHFNQTKVRQLIKLVKSTSIYIIGSQTSLLAAAPAPAVEELRAVREPCSGRESDQQQEQVAREDKRNNRFASIRAAREACRHLEDGGRQCDEADGDEEIVAEVNGVKSDRESAGEIGDTLQMNINYMDGRFMKWWMMCVCVTILHFSLSEVELSKSHHLWQWLDDYSMHQLNNQTIGTSTLMFLASFDNYIYTVHVYGTRLIGASIICIVCSLQRENIVSLRWHALQLIRQSPTTNLAGGASRRRKSLGACREPRCTRIDPWPGANNNYESIEIESSCGDSNSESPAGSCWHWKSTTTDSTGTAVSALTTAAAAGAGSGRASSPWHYASDIDRDLFFVLGESSWLKVYESARDSRPSGYLSSTLYKFTRSLMEPLSRLVGLVLASFAIMFSKEKFCARLLCASSSFRGIFMKRATPRNNQIGDVVLGACQQQQQQQQQQHNCNITPANSCATSANHNNNKSMGRQPGQLPAKTTPNPTAPSAMTSLDQIASSIMFSAGHRAGAACHSGATAAHGALVNRPHNNHHRSRVGWPTPKASRPVAFRDTDAPAKQQAKETHFEGRKVFTPINSDNGDCSPASAGSSAAGHSIEWQLERLASKYELVRTVNARIDSCFGPMLLIQYSFLFLMSCIDVVYFSICFNPNTKTKYIIISGMILLWWPYLLLYKFASDIGTDSKELLISVRRLARLWLLEHHNRCQINNGAALPGADMANIPPPAPPLKSRYSSWLHYGSYYRCSNNFRASNMGRVSRFGKAFGGHKFTYSPYADACDFPHYLSLLHDNTNRDKTSLRAGDKWPLTKRFWPRHSTNNSSTLAHDEKSSSSSPPPDGRPSRACIINKLDHVFKPTYLSIMGIMTVDKFFLLNFAKIVITASVMIIQFIT